MPGKPRGARALTGAERQDILRRKKATQAETWRQALERIAGDARTITTARRIAAKALGREPLSGVTNGIQKPRDLETVD
jgi:hypothetical protein